MVSRCDESDVVTRGAAAIVQVVASGLISMVIITSADGGTPRLATD
ncbi:MAG: hypothetical protein AB7N65_05500 [Vicinamibacterales bacterium]